MTLYELLTLRPLFAESDRTKLIERILHDEPVPPRQHRSPHSARPGDDRAEGDGQGARGAVRLGRGAGRGPAPVPRQTSPCSPARSARPRRLARWCRRQPKLATAVGLAAASLVLATALSISLAWSQYRAAARLRAEQALTLAEKTRAEENFRDAQQAVEDYLIRVSDETLLQHQDSGEIRQLRKQLLEDALKYYQRFLARQGNDPKLLADLAHVSVEHRRHHRRDRLHHRDDQRLSTSGLDLGADRPREPDRSRGPQRAGGVPLAQSPIGRRTSASMASRFAGFEQALAILVPLTRSQSG